MGRLTPAEWAVQKKRKREIEQQAITDPKFQSRPQGKAPEATMGTAKPFSRDEIKTLAKKHAINIWSRPSHKKSDYE